MNINSDLTIVSDSISTQFEIFWELRLEQTNSFGGPWDKRRFFDSKTCVRNSYAV